MASKLAQNNETMEKSNQTEDYHLYSQKTGTKTCQDQKGNSQFEAI